MFSLHCPRGRCIKRDFFSLFFFFFTSEKNKNARRSSRSTSRRSIVTNLLLSAVSVGRIFINYVTRVVYDSPTGRFLNPSKKNKNPAFSRCHRTTQAIFDGRFRTRSDAVRRSVFLPISVRLDRVSQYLRAQRIGKVSNAITCGICVPRRVFETSV